MKKSTLSWIQGEIIGTFLLVFFGCGSVATAVAVGAPVGLFQIAIIWGMGLASAIYLTGKLSGAHFNPAITIAFAFFTDFPAKRVPGYIMAQLIGAFLAAVAVYTLFGGAIEAYEAENEIRRGKLASVATAKIFGEYFPNWGDSGFAERAQDSAFHFRACFAELLGTALLALAIFGFIAKGNRTIPDSLIPAAIGMTLTVLICIFAPISQAGFNPARDFAPRLFSFFAGWGKISFSANGIGWLTVYILSPIVGALIGGFVASKLVYGDGGEDGE